MMKKLHRMTAEQVAWMNEKGGTNFDIIYQVSDNDSDEGYASLSHDVTTDKWILFMNDRLYESEAKIFMVSLACIHGYDVCE